MDYSVIAALLHGNRRRFPGNVKNSHHSVCKEWGTSDQGWPIKSHTLIIKGSLDWEDLTLIFLWCNVYGQEGVEYFQTIMPQPGLARSQHKHPCPPKALFESAYPCRHSSARLGQLLWRGVRLHHLLCSRRHLMLRHTMGYNAAI